MLKVLDVDKRKKIKGLSPARADIMPAAMAIVKSFVSYMNIESFTIGGSGLREGLMVNQALPITVEKPISDVLGYSLDRLVKYYNCDPKHIEHVMQLSVQLFKQLRVLHKFSRQYLKVLKIAAMMLVADIAISSILDSGSTPESPQKTSFLSINHFSPTATSVKPHFMTTRKSNNTSNNSVN